MSEIADPDRAPADLVLVSRADAAAGGADLAGAAGVLAQRVEIAVEGQDQRAIVGDAQRLGGGVDALLRQAGRSRRARPRDRARRRCRSPRACRGRCPKGAATACRPCRRRRACARHCGRPGSAPPYRRARRASRRSCPCPRRPIGRRSRRHWPHGLPWLLRVPLRGVRPVGPRLCGRPPPEGHWKVASYTHPGAVRAMAFPCPYRRSKSVGLLPWRRWRMSWL